MNSYHEGLKNDTVATCYNCYRRYKHCRPFLAVMPMVPLNKSVDFNHLGRVTIFRSSPPAGLLYPGVYWWGIVRHGYGLANRCYCFNSRSARSNKSAWVCLFTVKSRWGSEKTRGCSQMHSSIPAEQMRPSRSPPADVRFQISWSVRSLWLYIIKPTLFEWHEVLDCHVIGRVDRGWSWGWDADEGFSCMTFQYWWPADITLISKSLTTSQRWKRPLLFSCWLPWTSTEAGIPTLIWKPAFSQKSRSSTWVPEILRDPWL